MKKILLHVCCGPCSLTPVKYLREQGFEVTAFFFNPNIHPEEEYTMRREAMAKAASLWNVPVLWEGKAENPRQWLHGLGGETSFGARCLQCYAQRLDATAKAAKVAGFGGFSTSLLYSRYQNQAGIKETAEAAAKRHDISFYFDDFRPYWQEGIELSKAMGLYRQKWCGCILSREESLKMMAEKAAKKLQK